MMLDKDFYIKNNDLIHKCINELTHIFSNIFSDLFFSKEGLDCAVEIYTIENNPWISILDIIYILNFEPFQNLSISVFCTINQGKYIITVSIFTNSKLFDRMEFVTTNLSIAELIAGIDSIRKMLKTAMLDMILNDTTLDQRLEKK